MDSEFQVTDLNPGCEARTVVWTDLGGGLICEASADEGEPDEQLTLQDIALPITGTVGLECVNQNWVVEPGTEQCETAPAGLRQVELSLTADGGSRFYEYFSDAFAQIDQGWNGSAVLDGFFLISSLPGFSTIGGGFDMFPLEGDWVDIITMDYDVDGLTGIGSEQAPIVALVADFNPFIPGNGTILARPYTTEFSAISGMVNLFDGDIVSIETLQATVTFVFDTSDLIGVFGLGATLEAEGNFIVLNDGSFTLYSASEAPLTLGTPDVEWDLSGQVNPASFN